MSKILYGLSNNLQLLKSYLLTWKISAIYCQVTKIWDRDRVWRVWCRCGECRAVLCCVCTLTECTCPWKENCLNVNLMFGLGLPCASYPLSQPNRLCCWNKVNWCNLTAHCCCREGFLNLVSHLQKSSQPSEVCAHLEEEGSHAPWGDPRPRWEGSQWINMSSGVLANI